MERVALTISDIEAWLSDSARRKGRAYLDRLTDLQLQGLTLRGQARGSDPQPYLVRVTLQSKGGVTGGQCSCPVGSGGRCKHAAALLLRYAQDPEAFEPVPELREALAGWTQEQLVQLIERMIHLHPDLNELVLGSTAPEADSTSVHGLFEQVRRAYHPWRDEYHEGPDSTLIWQAVERVEQEAVDAPSMQEAVRVYRTVLQEIHASYEQWQTDSEFDDLLYHTLGLCVALTESNTPQDVRRDALDALMWAFEVGVALPFEENLRLLAANLSEQERVDLLTLFRTQAARQDEWSATYFARALLHLEDHSTLDPTEHERLLLLAEDIHALLRLYLERKDATQIQSLMKRFGWRVNLLDAEADFVRCGQEDLLEQLVAGRARQQAWSPNEETVWLYERLVQTERPGEALVLARQVLLRSGRVEWFDRVKQLSSSWKRERTELFRRLSGERFLRSAHLRLLLHEGLLQDAEKLYARHAVEVDETSALALADALKGSPERAAAVYWGLAERYIELRGRENYRVACGHLKSARELLPEEGWPERIGVLAAKYKPLRALQEELRNAKLLV